MSSFIKNVIIQKLNHLTSQELLFYSKQYGFSLSQSEVDQIIYYLKSNPIQPFDSNNREKMLKELAKITDHKTARKAEHLFNHLIKTYGLEHLFN